MNVSPVSFGNRINPRGDGLPPKQYGKNIPTSNGSSGRSSVKKYAKREVGEIRAFVSHGTIQIQKEKKSMKPVDHMRNFLQGKCSSTAVQEHVCIFLQHPHELLQALFGKSWKETGGVDLVMAVLEKIIFHFPSANFSYAVLWMSYAQAVKGRVFVVYVGDVLLQTRKEEFVTHKSLWQAFCTAISMMNTRKDLEDRLALIPQGSSAGIILGGAWHLYGKRKLVDLSSCLQKSMQFSSSVRDVVQFFPFFLLAECANEGAWNGQNMFGSPFSSTSQGLDELLIGFLQEVLSSPVHAGSQVVEIAQCLSCLYGEFLQTDFIQRDLQYQHCIAMGGGAISLSLYKQYGEFLLRNQQIGSLWVWIRRSLQALPQQIDTEWLLFDSDSLCDEECVVSAGTGWDWQRQLACQLFHEPSSLVCAASSLVCQAFLVQGKEKQAKAWLDLCIAKAPEKGVFFLARARMCMDPCSSFFDFWEARKDLQAGLRERPSCVGLVLENVRCNIVLQQLLIYVLCRLLPTTQGRDDVAGSLRSVFSPCPSLGDYGEAIKRLRSVLIQKEERAMWGPIVKDLQEQIIGGVVPCISEEQKARAVAILLNPFHSIETKEVWLLYQCAQAMRESLRQDLTVWSVDHMQYVDLVHALFSRKPFAPVAPLLEVGVAIFNSVTPLIHIYYEKILYNNCPVAAEDRMRYISVYGASPFNPLHFPLASFSSIQKAALFAGAVDSNWIL